MKIDQLINLIYRDYKLDPEGAIKELRHNLNIYFWLSILSLTCFMFSLFLLAVFVYYPFNIFLFVAAMASLSVLIWFTSSLHKIVKAIKIIQSLINHRGGEK